MSCRLLSLRLLAPVGILNKESQRIVAQARPVEMQLQDPQGTTFTARGFVSSGRDSPKFLQHLRARGTKAIPFTVTDSAQLEDLNQAWIQTDIRKREPSKRRSGTLMQLAEPFVQVVNGTEEQKIARGYRLMTGTAVGMLSLLIALVFIWIKE